MANISCANVREKLCSKSKLLCINLNNKLLRKRNLYGYNLGKSWGVSNKGKVGHQKYIDKNLIDI